MITFVWPLAFLLLPLPWLLRYSVKARKPSQNGALHVPFFTQLASQPRDYNVASPTIYWRFILAALIWFALVIALARPVIAGKEIPLPTKGRDIMLAIDLSGSMEQEDLRLDGSKATRLAVVKDAANTFISRRKGDRLGLVLFSDRAYVQSPLTFDRQAVQTLLKQAQVGLTGQKTAIGDAIAIAIKRLKDRPEQNRILILLTDGANNAGVMQPLQAAQLAKKLGVRIYTIGVGANAMAVNTPFGQQLVNPSQDLDEDTLHQLATITGGRYFRATDVQGLAKIYQDINQLEPVSSDPVVVRPKIALYYLPASAALILSALFALLLLLGTLTTPTRLAKGE